MMALAKQVARAISIVFLELQSQIIYLTSSLGKVEFSAEQSLQT